MRTLSIISLVQREDKRSKNLSPVHCTAEQTRRVRNVFETGNPRLVNPPGRRRLDSRQHLVGDNRGAAGLPGEMRAKCQADVSWGVGSPGNGTLEIPMNDEPKVTLRGRTWS